MGAVVFAGEATTTTALAVAAAWPTPAFVVECDPSGGSLAAWLDMSESPSLSTAVTALHQAGPDRSGSIASRRLIEPMIRRSAAGVRVLVAPSSRREARTSVAESARLVVPSLVNGDHVALIDAGRLGPMVSHPALGFADAVVIVHRQHDTSPRAAAVRLERLAELVDEIRDVDCPVGVVIIGEEPFALGEIAALVPVDVGHWSLAHDPLSAAVLAGRDGVSARRLSRLPLMRDARRLADDLCAVVAPSRAAVGPIVRTGEPAAAS